MFVTASDDQTVRLWDVASKVNTNFGYHKLDWRSDRISAGSSVCTCLD